MSRVAVPLPQRFATAVGQSNVAERVAAAQDAVYGPILNWARHSPLHTTRLGHSLHPPLTDVTLGCWLGATVLDLAGGVRARPGATLLVGVGVAAAVPTAVAGAADYSELTGSARRVAAVHALGTDTATFLFMGSLVGRLRGHHGLGVGLAVTGSLVMVGSGFLGGHLALTRGVARRMDRPDAG